MLCIVPSELRNSTDPPRINAIDMRHIFAAYLIQHHRGRYRCGCRHRSGGATLDVHIHIRQLAVVHHILLGEVVSGRDRTHRIHAHVDLHRALEACRKIERFRSPYPESPRSVALARCGGFRHCAAIVAMLYRITRLASCKPRYMTEDSACNYHCHQPTANPPHGTSYFIELVSSIASPVLSIACSTASANAFVPLVPPTSLVSVLPSRKTCFQTGLHSFRSCAFIDVMQHQHCALQQRSRIGHIFTGDIGSRSMHRLEDRAFGPEFAPGTNPSPPTNALQRSLRMSPYKFSVSRISYWKRIHHKLHAGVIHNVFAVLHLRESLSATVRQQRRNRPSDSFMMFALWIAWTFLRPCLRA